MYSIPDSRDPSSANSNERVWVRPKIAREMLGCGPTTLYELIKRNRIVSRRVGGMRLISIASIKEIADDEAA